MLKFFKKYFWTILIVVAALGLAGSAAYFSITGLSKLFAGSAMQVIILASFLEFAKIATTAALHRFWKSISWGLKIPLTIMVVVIMGITSAGIYGFLSDAYSTTSVQLEKIEGQVDLLEKQQEQKDEQILGIEEMKTSKSNRMTSLIDLRSQQEVRLDSLLANHHWQNAKKTQEQIDAASSEIVGLQTDIDSLISKINGVNEEIGVLDISILELQHTDVATEIGPLKYMSTVLEQPMENIINWFILAIMIAFDPLAILLVILANVIYDRASGKDKDNDNKTLPKKGFIGRIRERLAKKRGPNVINHDIELTKEDLDKLVKGEMVMVSQGEVEGKEAESEDKGLHPLWFAGASYNYPFNPDDFPNIENKADEVIEYVAGEDGEFKRAVEDDEPSESLSEIIKGIDSNPVYLQLIDVLFKDGERAVGVTIPPYRVLVQDIKNKGIDCEDRVVKNFLTICNLMAITNMSNKDNVTIIKDYEPSKQIISLVSK